MTQVLTKVCCCKAPLESTGPAAYMMPTEERELLDLARLSSKTACNLPPDRPPDIEVTFSWLGAFTPSAFVAER